MTADDLDRALGDLGAEPVPAPDPQFVVRLEAQLRAEHPGGRSPVWWRRPRITVPLALGAALAATVFGIVLAGPPRAAVDTEGTGIAGQPATTIDVDDAPVPDVTEAPRPGDTSADISPGEPSPGADRPPLDSDESPVTSAPAPAPTPEPVPGPGAPDTEEPPPPTTTTERPARTTTTSTTAASTTTTTPVDRRPFRASATRRDERTVVIRWTAFTGDRVASYRVVRRPPGGSTESSVVVAHQRASADRVAVDEVASDGEYVVQALDADGRVLDRTDPVAP